MTERTYKLLSYVVLFLYLLLSILSVVHKDYLLASLWIIAAGLQIVNVSLSKK